jgi:ABC-type dipeptide/oligopeptide/nickel transport system permease component
MGAGLFGYAIRRLLWCIPVLFAVSVIVFTVVRMAPGDPVDTLLGQRYDPVVAARLRHKYGYDQPINEQYFTYMNNLFHGDLGVSTRHQDFTVKQVVLPKMWVSTQIGFYAMIITFLLGIPVGVYAALARGTFLDPLIISSWLLLDAIPVFVLIPVAQWFFAARLGIVGLGYEGVYSSHMILPILIVGLTGVAGVARLMRASVITVMGEDYVRTARAKGLRETTVIITHVARNALLPMVSIIGLSLPGLVAGDLFVEQLFGIPGIGQESLQAVLAPDFDVVLFFVLLSSTLFVLANVVFDLLYGVIDPRIRIGEARG